MRRAPDKRRGALAAVAALAMTLCALPCSAQQDWNPFRDQSAAPPPRSQPAASSQAPAAPVRPQPPQPPTRSNDDVERGELPPIPGTDSAGGAAAGDTTRSIEAMINGLDIPSRSPALSVLYRKFLGDLGAGTPEIVALKAEALYRIGRLDEAADLLRASRGDHAVVSALVARTEVALGRRESGCAAAKAASARRAELPPPLRGEMMAISGYCLAAAGDAPGAGLIAGLAREEGGAAPQTLAALEAIALGQKAQFAADATLSALDYRLSRLGGAGAVSLPVEGGETALLAVLVNSTDAEPVLRIAAAEAAARVNIIGPQKLAEIYREQRFAPRDLIEPLQARVAPALRRSLLLQSAEFERNPSRRARAMRALADDARRNGLYLQVLALLADQVDAMTPAHEIGWFSETAVEVLLAAGRFERAATWAAFGTGPDRRGPGTLEHWLALIDVAAPQPAWRRGEYLGAVEEMALRGRFSPDALSRVASVLDALDYNVPMRLWEAASRTPQPGGGHLPETGVLSDLQAAAKTKDTGRTILLAIRALGPPAAEGAHIIALGDTIRALKSAGLEPHARRIAFEALFASWPRSAHN